MPENKNHYDLIILGAGPAGMTAGVYAARKQIDTLIITEDIGGQATWSSGIENYLGFVYVTGAELVQKFEEHLRKFDITLIFSGVSRLAYNDGIYTVVTTNGDRYYSRAVIVATGKSPKLLNVPGEKEFTGKGVAYCSTCDGPMFEGMEVAVVGGGNSGLDSVVQLMKICPKVYLIEYAPKLRADEVMQKQAIEHGNVEIMVSTAVREIKGDAFVNSIVVEDLTTNQQKEIPVKGVFVEVGLSPNTSFMGNLVDLNEYGEIPVDCAGRAGLPGLYAAGDVTNVPEKQIIIAAGDGAKSALGVYSYLVRLPNVAEDWGYNKTSV
ncbi:MAG: FAD-dependent oxidoreductase [Armatimonadota bacterium]